MSKITEKDLEKRAEFFSKHILGIKYTGEVYFVSKTVTDDYTGREIKNPCLGCFVHHENSWDVDLDDEDYGVPHEYDCDYVLDSKTTLEDCDIEISELVQNDVLHLNDVLLHELIHFNLWYKGLDHKDGQKQFEDALREYGVSSNYGYIFNEKLKKWEFNVNRKQMQIYEDMYQGFIKSNQ